MRPFEYIEPTSIDEAIDWLGRKGRNLSLAGGTDLLVRLKRRQWAADCVVALRRISSLRGVRRGSNETWIGPLTTIDELTKSDEIARECPLLIEAALLMASPQVRALATVGGNLCNASPAADLAPPLLCLDAILDATGPGGTRAVPIREFFTGPGKTVLGCNELLTGIRVPTTRGRGTFLKFSPRRAMDLAIASVACLRTADNIRMALGAVASTPILVPPDQAAESCAPIDDVRASAEYRQHLVRVLARRALEQVS